MYDNLRYMNESVKIFLGKNEIDIGSCCILLAKFTKSSEFYIVCGWSIGIYIGVVFLMF